MLCYHYYCAPGRPMNKKHWLVSAVSSTVRVQSIVVYRIELSSHYQRYSILSFYQFTSVLYPLVEQRSLLIALNRDAMRWRRIAESRLDFATGSGGEWYRNLCSNGVYQTEYREPSVLRSRRKLWKPRHGCNPTWKWEAPRRGGENEAEMARKSQFCMEKAMFSWDITHVYGWGWTSPSTPRPWVK